MMLKTSEWVSMGHPDKVADGISCYVLDRYLERDPKTRYALEVQIKDKYVTLGGEITSGADYSDAEIAGFVREAVNRIGYTAEYQKRWGAENTICGDELEVVQHIGKQSPDIAQGVDSDGWGDQGIFWGMAVDSQDTDYMPKDWYLAKKIGKHLYDSRYAGLDIKTQVTICDGGIDEIVVAIPMLDRHYDYDIENVVKFCCGDRKYKNLHINGTGRFVKHGPVGDCGTTGRKLAVDFYGGNCRIGGGSPWTKDGTKADLTLNMLARELAVDFLRDNELPEVHCAISCRIGSPEIRVAYYGADMSMYDASVLTMKPETLIAGYHLREPIFFQLCYEGLFTV